MPKSSLGQPGIGNLERQTEGPLEVRVLEYPSCISSSETFLQVQRRGLWSDVEKSFLAIEENLTMSITVDL